MQWSVVGLMLRSIHQLAPSTPGGRVVVLGTTFTALLLACMYTSSYTALITVNNLKAEVSSMDDLIGLPVGIAEVRRKSVGAGNCSYRSTRGRAACSSCLWSCTGCGSSSGKLIVYRTLTEVAPAGRCLASLCSG